MLYAEIVCMDYSTMWNLTEDRTDLSLVKPYLPFLVPSAASDEITKRD